MNLVFDTDVTIESIQQQLADIIDNPIFLDLDNDVQNIIIDMFDVVNTAIFDK